jgi:hypothetical protein
MAIWSLKTINQMVFQYNMDKPHASKSSAVTQGLATVTQASTGS